MAYERKGKRMSRWSSSDIKALRKRYDESQGVFCRRLGVSADALQYWEQDRGSPSQPIELLLERLEEDVDSASIRDVPGMAAVAAT